ncbi:hypothetical protein D3C77_324170 [compost metagenome]
MIYVREGWGRVKGQFPSVIILFLYQLLWGFFLYRIINQIIISLLERYPDSSLQEMSRLLFIFEGQLGYQHNSDIKLALIFIIGMIGLRILLSPLIQAGILYGLVPEGSRKSGLSLFRGMQQFGKPVFLIYIVEWLLIFSPAYFIFPKLSHHFVTLFQTGVTLPLLLTVTAYLAFWLSYSWIVRQCSLFIQFGFLFQQKITPSFLVFLRSILKGILISCVLGLSLVGISILFGSLSFVWTGILALVLQQCFPLFRSIFTVWRVTAQYQLWEQSSQK